MALKRVHFCLEQDEDGYPPVAVESLWTKQGEDSDEYVIDSVPFFVRDATLGDAVRARMEDGGLWFDGLLKRSQNSLVRIVFFDQTCVDEMSNQLRTMGCLTEYLREHDIMAVSIPMGVSLPSIQRYLQEEANAGRIDYEEPILRQ